MRVLDIINGDFITLICEPVPESEITSKVKLIGSNGNAVFDNSGCDEEEPNFYVSFSKPCFSQKQTMFVNIIQGSIGNIGVIKYAEFI